MKRRPSLLSASRRRAIAKENKAAQRAWDTKYPASAKARRANRRRLAVSRFITWCHEKHDLTIVAIGADHRIVSPFTLLDEHLGIDRAAVSAELKAMSRSLAEKAEREDSA